jgi:hypothetical protein
MSSRTGTEPLRASMPAVALSRERLLAKWRDRAEEFRHVVARVNAAALCDAFVRDLDALDVRVDRELLTLGQASEISGYSAAQLRRLAKQGKLIASGRGRSWRIARADLPVKASAVAPRCEPLHVHRAKTGQDVRERVGLNHKTPR